MICGVLLNTTLVSALTAAAKVAPLLWVSVRFLSDALIPCGLYPRVLVTFTTPALVAFKVSDWVLAALPITAPLMFKLPPAVVSTTSPVKVTPVAEPATLSPKLMAFKPLVLICPAALMLLGAVAVKPPANVNVSVALLPRVRVPVLLNTVAA